MWCTLTLLIIFLCIVCLLYKCFYNEPVDLSHDVILITGAAHGLGRLLAIILSKYCGNIIAIDRNMEGLKETAARVLKQSNISLKCYECDLSNREAIKQCAEHIRKDHGRVTVLVSNAGISNGNFLLDIPMSKVEKLIQVNLVASIHLMKEFLPGMLGSSYKSTLQRIPPHMRATEEQKVMGEYCSDEPPRGHIVFISSITGQMAASCLADYCASKAGLSIMADALRLELTLLGVGRDIAVTDVRPFAIDTGMFEGVRSRLLSILKAEETVERIVDAIRYRHRTVYIPRSMWIFSILYRLVPFPILRYGLNLAGSYNGMLCCKTANRSHD